MILKFERINFKKLLSAVGLLTIVTPVALSVVACNSNQDNTVKPEKLVVNAITEIDSYFVTIPVNSSVVIVKAEVNNDFIKSNLSKEIQKIFDCKLFRLIGICNAKNKSLTNKDLTEAKTINGKIYYSYGQINDQIVNLIINVNGK